MLFSLSEPNMKFQVFCLLVSFTVAQAASPNWKKCPASDPNVEDCLREAIQMALKDLAHGSKLGFQDFEPASHDKIAIIDTTTGPIRGKLIYNDISIAGFTEAEVKKVEKKGNGVIRIKFYFPKTSIKGKYLMDTILLAVPMKGNGDFSMNNEKLTITFEFKIGTKDVNGVKVYNAETVSQSSFNLEYLQVHHTNLFNGNKALGDNVNKILNEQWRTLAKELGPITVKAFGPVFSKITNEVLNKIPVADYPIPLD